MDYTLRLINAEIMNMAGRLAAMESDGQDCRQIKTDLSRLIADDKLIRTERGIESLEKSSPTEAGLDN